jgi:hypothetical protein
LENTLTRKEENIMSEQVVKTRTMGKFIVKSKHDPSFVYEGYSKQCEIAFRDYMSWCLKGKGPKSIQAEYDKHPELAGKTDEIFILTIDPLTPEEFVKTTGKSIETNRKIPATITQATLTTSEKLNRINVYITEVVQELKENPDIADPKVVFQAMIDKIKIEADLIEDGLEESSGADEEGTSYERQIYDEYKSGVERKSLCSAYDITKKQLDAIIKKFEG